eukprot:CAMPEP_0116064220 /NCGR_PEP_ID=MMETSP0322-20121206/8957_1 /TAXON_ID=163516 /ORGANISM="Leptocylindrus danicus var. apora, Strain B651" /LENGTH=228 /DNA_ID=CAMNT_0003550141 /DNA_START=379 /DNA_END=1065 /DNA_ORIENTATION=+
MPITQALANEQETVISLKGSVSIVSEFFYYAVNSILYQRGIYPPETFKRESKYGLTVLTSTDEGLTKYLDQIMDQMSTWLLEGQVQRLVIAISGIETNETLERWQFQVTVEDKEGESAVSGVDENNAAAGNVVDKAKVRKSIKEIHNDIQAIIRQITASVTFLPLLNEPCSFDLLVYTNLEAIVPKKWEESDPRYIINSQEVKLRSFSTSVHKVDSLVTYKETDEWDL